MPKRSAGLLLYRQKGGALQVLLVHPGGPFWAKKDAGVWSIPKGEYAESETPLAAARRECAEELGIAPQGPFTPLGEVRQAGGKIVTAFAVEQDFDPAALVSNTFELEWPPGSGRKASFPEIDRAQWFPLDEAAGRILPGQRPFLTRLAQILDDQGPD
ncbi:MAG: NUDIX domain-containing protein [Pseudorhodoplanes sp.]|nr:NUDIX domain-containing protein [Pseudorhodoplanes sp.]